ncbi:MAG TPA: M14 family zinc carboxypeptidase, partial [Fimbriimonas sp.]|nr:M14 family zinc carboxypeptidase [Fimbriimonas sp.]
LAEGKGDPAKTLPIAWINECIHGDETASFESAMWTFYNLVAAKSGPVAKALENEIVILNPSYNPDGHERYVVYYNSIATGSDDPYAYENREPSVIFGRLNHYRFDMNRDRVAFSQDETREEFAEMLKWNPQVYIDQHGQVGSYFFPPEPMSINVNVDRARNAKWTDIFGRATGRAFDANGLSYFIKDEFDLYYPGYLDASNTLSGAIGMTHETDGGRVLASRRDDGSVLTLRQGMAKHFTSALAVVEATSEHGSDLLADYAKFKKNASTGKSAGTFQRVVLTAPDDRPLKRFQKHLSYAGIHSYFVEPFSQSDAHDYWTGKKGPVKFDGSILVVDMAQPQGALAKALLEPTSDFEPEFSKAQTSKKSAVPDGEKYPGPDEPEFYDFTGWSLPYAYDLQAWWCESAPKTPENMDNFPDIPPFPRKSSIGYALRYRDLDDILAVHDVLAAGVRAAVTSKAMTLDGTAFPAGTFLFLADRNEDGFEKILHEVANHRGVQFIALRSAYPDSGREGPGSGTVISLKQPKVAVIMGSGDRMSQCGAMWYLMDRVFHLPFAAISQEALNGDLSRYTCIVVPQGATLPHTDKVREWLSAGNVAVSLGSTGWVSQYVELPEVKGDVQGLPGSLFRANMDMRSFLMFGYDRNELAVPLEGDRFYSRRKEGGSVVVLPGADKSKLLSGWEWPNDTEKNLADALFLQDQPVGRGHVVVFTEDPTARAMWPGLYKALLNAMLIGAGS